MINILRVSNLPHDMLTVLQTTYIMHDRDHITDPGALGRIRAMVAMSDAVIDKKLMMLFPAVEIICICGSSSHNVDHAAAEQRNIKVCHAAYAHVPDQAEYAIGLMLAASRRIAHGDRFVRNSDWVDGPYPLTRRMSGARLGLVGMGPVAQAIAGLASSFDMAVSYTAAQAEPEVAWSFNPSVKDLAAGVDFLVLPEMGPDAPPHLVNLANAGAVDMAALTEALQKKTIAGAALDVFPEEPRVAAELRALHNVVLTPHTGSATAEARQAMGDQALRQLAEHFATDLAADV
jgi:lactate dehydrogenase-like 2-hydroxyacid dehydrogenase